jgi:hypothetical protein
MRGGKLITALIVSNLLLVGAMLLLLRNEMVRARGELVQTTPHLISYHGMLTDDDGNPIKGTKDLTITVYESGTAVVPLWQEVHQDVAVDAGAFAVLLGENTSLPDDLFNSRDRWMEIEIDGVKLSPRQRFTSVPYAINADKVDGYDASELQGGDGLPSGAVVWFRDGVTPTGYTRMDALGLDIGPWELLADSPTVIENASCDIWTGIEVLCWGASQNGARYNVATNSWKPITTTDAPIGRLGSDFDNVWTGSEMIVWGGENISSFLNIGGRYNPVTDSWTPVTSTNAPVSRTKHSAIWTGSEMIIWGGEGASGFLNTGGRYNPVTDSWTPITTTDAPISRSNHSAVWTGSEMIVWDAEYPGGLYDPVTDSWRDMNTDGEPPFDGYWFHQPIWTGSEMAVLRRGGVPDGFGDFVYLYNPSSNTWRRILHRSSEGRRYSSGAPGRTPVVADDLLVTYDGVYDLSQDKWVALTIEKVYDTQPTKSYPAYWTGERALFLGSYRTLSHTIDIIYPYVKD